MLCLHPISQRHQPMALPKIQGYLAVLFSKRKINPLAK
ncbi:hypothetical protein VCHE40_2377 [Vibrio cholerae HE-40]|nr:hypothetical protein VCHE39_3068 [Vibrio cholerae HE39]EGR07868.1 hypothetical protein VCHE48_3419 [Vibrio cholerae HE48]EKL27691.1 hypothetical protein VCHE40_2377 [Vibrio cholerae HE-40]EKL34485.1 hypothetical protein VCHE46_2384 [Vibrio cholerae HE-46]